MKIETPLHYAGARELVRRYRDALVESAKHMPGSAYANIENQLNRQIEYLEESIEEYRREQNLLLMTKSWFTLTLTSDGVRQYPSERCEVRVETLKSSPPLQSFPAFNEKPAEEAGFSFWSKTHCSFSSLSTKTA